MQSFFRGTRQDEYRVKALFGGAPELSALLRRIAPAAGTQTVVRQIFDAYDEASRANYVRNARPKAYEAAKAALSAYNNEARLILRRRQMERSAHVLVNDALRIAMARNPTALPSTSFGEASSWAEQDRRRLAQLRARIVMLRTTRDKLVGSGRPSTFERRFAECLAPIFTRLTNRAPTVTTPPDADLETGLGDFASFVEASARLAGIEIHRTLLMSICREIARRTSRPSA